MSGIELDQVAIGIRVKLLRAGSGLTVEEAGRAWCWSPISLRNCEAGRTMLPPQVAAKLSVDCAVTMEWLYRGDEAHLTAAARRLVRKLAVARDTGGDYPEIKR